MNELNDLSLPLNSMEVLKKRYLLKDDDQNIVETPDGLFRRVASNIAKAESNFKSASASKDIEEEFYMAMRNLNFLPNSPTLMNAGTFLGQLSACFVLPVEDSIDDIFSSLKDMAKIHQTGGGTGFSFSHLRPKGDLVSTTKGAASGPVSFMSIFDRATGVIVQGGRRRGANMGILRCDHPDIIEFIEAKLEPKSFSNFNLSIGITDKFMAAVEKDEEFDLVNPRTKKRARKINARATFNLMVNSAWKTGDPGLVFLDEVNRKNPTPAIEDIEATNPCGELPLLPYESCNLASINLSRMVKDGAIDWKKFKNYIHMGIRFLDDVIEVNKFPLSEIKDITFANRKVGLGVMGFADMLIKLGIPYNSKKAVTLAEDLMQYMHKESISASVYLAKERGVFPNYAKSVYAKKVLKVRNATVNTIAPTGTISIIAGCSSGIEPLFAVTFIRHILSGTKLFEINPMFEEIAKEKRIYKEALLSKIARHGSLQKIKGIPSNIKRIFVTSFDVRAEQHLMIQAAFQRYCDNSVSKTINLPPYATADDVRDIYMSAYKLKLKGITIYRYGSKPEQVLTFDASALLGINPERSRRIDYKEKKRYAEKSDLVTAESEYSGGCVTGTCPF